MIDKEGKLPVSSQAKLLLLSRSSVYYRKREVSESNLVLMHRIDRLHLEYPFAGSRMLRSMMKQEGLDMGRRHIRSLMKKMGIEALYCKKNISKRKQSHRIYPYLLRGLCISRPNQVWAMDTTYIPMKKDFSIYRPFWTGLPVRYCRSAYPIPRQQMLVWKRLKKRYTNTEDLKS